MGEEPEQQAFISLDGNEWTPAGIADYCETNIADHIKDGINAGVKSDDVKKAVLPIAEAAQKEAVNIVLEQMSNAISMEGR